MDDMLEKTAKPLPDENGVHFVDFLSACVESWKIVLIVPLLIGIVVYGYVKLFPVDSFMSTTVLRLTPIHAAATKDPRILDRVAKELGYLEARGGSIAASRADAASRYRFYEESEERYIGNFTENSPERAQRMGKAVLDGLFEISKPKDYEKVKLERQLETWQQAKARFEAGAETFRRTAGIPAVEGATPEPAGNLVREYAGLIDGARNADIEIGKINDELRGIGTETVLDPPTLPTVSTVSATVTAAIAALVAFVLVVLGVTVAETVRQFRRRDWSGHYERFMKSTRIK